MYAIFAQVGPALGRALSTAAAPQLAKIGARIGSAANPQAIIAAAKNNPVTAALVTMELGDMGSKIYDMIVGAHPDVPEKIANAVDTVFRADKVAPGTRASIAQQREELEVISKAARAVGGFEQLLAVRNALLLDDEHYGLYRDLSTLPRFRV